MLEPLAPIFFTPYKTFFNSPVYLRATVVINVIDSIPSTYQQDLFLDDFVGIRRRFLSKK
jgi:hypothetical protein